MSLRSRGTLSCFSQNPRLISGRAIEIALGGAFTGVFSSSPSVYNDLASAGAAEYDRMWAMPLDEDGFGPQVYELSNSDLCNYCGPPGGSCTAALFLKNFVDNLEEGEGEGVKWAHADIAGTMEATRAGPYQEKGMTGRPVRALVEFARRLSGER
jgi:aminopeptidase